MIVHFCVLFKVWQWKQLDLTGEPSLEGVLPFFNIESKREVLFVEEKPVFTVLIDAGLMGSNGKHRDILEHIVVLETYHMYTIWSSVGF